MWLLGLKYGNFEKFSPNFLKTLEANFNKYENPVFAFLEGLSQHADFIKSRDRESQVAPLLGVPRSIPTSSGATWSYPFEFLEAFSPHNRAFLEKIIGKGLPSVKP